MYQQTLRSRLLVIGAAVLYILLIGKTESRYVESRLSGGVKQRFSGVNQEFHDKFKPLNAHLSTAPESNVLKRTVTNIGGPGEPLGKVNLSYNVI